MTFETAGRRSGEGHPSATWEDAGRPSAVLSAIQPSLLDQAQHAGPYQKDSETSFQAAVAAAPRWWSIQRERRITVRQAIRFWTYVDTSGGEDACWLWQSVINHDGYGRYNVGRAAIHNDCYAYAHRVAYLLARGPVPLGLSLDHLCRRRDCCNPYHLEPVTIRENTFRGETPARRNAEKTHCPRGHEYKVLSSGRRRCYACEHPPRKNPHGVAGGTHPVSP